ncbi:MAG: DUF3334 family protein, partial [Calditrichia bacterium]|nr:DUF3334 family protein [Calditrichia bacterium]
RPQCRRIAFRSADNHSFHIEFSMEETEFIPINQTDMSFARGTSLNPSDNNDVDDILKGL